MGRVRNVVRKTMVALERRREQKRPALDVAEAMAAQKLGRKIKASDGYEVTGGRTSAEDPTKVRLIIRDPKGNYSAKDITVPPTKGQKRMRAISERVKRVGTTLGRPILKGDAIAVAARGEKGATAKSLTEWTAENLGRGEGGKGRPSTAVEARKGNKAGVYLHRGKWRRLKRIG